MKTSIILACLLLVTPIKAQLVCDGGLFVETNEAGIDICSPCPEDTYKVGSNSDRTCTSCPDATPRNHQTGSSDPADCRYAACGQGQRYNAGNFLECIDCAIGTYQDKTYPLDFDPCDDCPTGTSTATVRSTSADCVGPCASGLEYYSVTQTCEPCAINFYKDNNAVARGEYTSCVQCPDAAFRTLGTGATSVSDCNIVTCLKGTYTDVVNNQCVSCGVDEYQNLDWQTSCNDCPIEHGTLDGETGANDITRCFPFCPDGEELINDLCYRCAIGYYKDNSDGRFENCTRCPDDNFITEGRRLSSL